MARSCFCIGNYITFQWFTKGFSVNSLELYMFNLFRLQESVSWSDCLLLEHAGRHMLFKYSSSSRLIQSLIHSVGYCRTHTHQMYCSFEVYSLLKVNNRQYKKHEQKLVLGKIHLRTSHVTTNLDIC